MTPRTTVTTQLWSHKGRTCSTKPPWTFHQYLSLSRNCTMGPLPSLSSEGSFPDIHIHSCPCASKSIGIAQRKQVTAVSTLAFRLRAHALVPPRLYPPLSAAYRMHPVCLEWIHG